MAAKPSPVCPEPKVFVGQLPPEATQAHVQVVMAKYGASKATLITDREGRSKGCAMVLFNKWAEAEVAVENENGKSSLGGNKPLVVKFADPPKKGDGPIIGIAPKKLFVGQVPSTVTQETLHSMFCAFGNVVELHLLQKGCAFVTYERWSQAEAAIEALNGRTHLEGAKAPLVVKFADAKDPNGGQGAVKRPMMHAGEAAGMMQAGGPAGQGAFNASKKASLGSAQAQAQAMMMAAGQYGPYGQMGAYDMQQAAAMGGLGYSGLGGMGLMRIAGQPAMMGMGMGMGNMNAMMMQQQQQQQGSMMHANGARGGMAMASTALGAGVTDETARQWKLFIGQVPFEANEADLWPIFSACGNILELVVLRGGGKSKGCAFVTYETRTMAETAIGQIDGQVTLPNDVRGKPLVVKFANPSSVPGSGAGGPGGGQSHAAAAAAAGGLLAGAPGGMGGMGGMNGGMGMGMGGMGGGMAMAMGMGHPHAMMQDSGNGMPVGM